MKLLIFLYQRKVCIWLCSWHLLNKLTSLRPCQAHNAVNNQPQIFVYFPIPSSWFTLSLSFQCLPWSCDLCNGYKPLQVEDKCGWNASNAYACSCGKLFKTFRLPGGESTDVDVPPTPAC